MSSCYRFTALTLALVLTVPIAGPAVADGVVVDRLYDPYVQPLETELELRSVAQFDETIADFQRHLFGIGRSLNDRWAVELYAIGSRTRLESLSLDAYEAELKWQISEQGEFALDWGLLFELEREVERNVWEISTSLLTARDFGRWTATANLDLVYEWGSGINNEFETRLHLQSRFRFREFFEPALELHLGQNTFAVGPSFTGLFRISAGKKFRWNLGFFAGLGNDSPEHIVRANLEYEF